MTPSFYPYDIRPKREKNNLLSVVLFLAAAVTILHFTIEPWMFQPFEAEASYVCDDVCICENLDDYANGSDPRITEYCADFAN